MEDDHKCPNSYNFIYDIIKYQNPMYRYMNFMFKEVLLNFIRRAFPA